MAPPRLSQDEVVVLAAEAVALVAAAQRVSRKALRVSRARKATFARQVAMYFVRLRGATYAQVGAMFGGRALATVQHALAVVEDAREDPALDAQLEALELTLSRRIKGRTAHGVEMPHQA